MNPESTVLATLSALCAALILSSCGTLDSDDYLDERLDRIGDMEEDRRDRIEDMEEESRDRIEDWEDAQRDRAEDRRERMEDYYDR